MTNNTDRAQSIVDHVIENYGVTREALVVLAAKFIEQDELREKYEQELKATYRIN